MRTYKGYVIDGPLKGETLESDDYVFHCLDNVELGLLSQNEVFDIKWPGQITYYLYVKSKEDLDRGKGFWSCLGGPRKQKKGQEVESYKL